MGKRWKQWKTIFLASKITVDGDCSCEIKRCLLFGGKAMTSLDNIWKSRDITLPTKVHIIKALWPPDVKSQLIRKDPDAGKDWRWEEKGMIEDKMVGWHHWLSGHEFEQAPVDGEGEGSLRCYSPRSHKELDTTDWLNNHSSPCKPSTLAGLALLTSQHRICPLIHFPNIYVIPTKHCWYKWVRYHIYLLETYGLMKETHE